MDIRISGVGAKDFSDGCLISTPVKQFGDTLRIVEFWRRKLVTENGAEHQRLLRRRVRQ